LILHISNKKAPKQLQNHAFSHRKAAIPDYSGVTHQSFTQNY
jgi:hypothetical protein